MLKRKNKVRKDEVEIVFKKRTWKNGKWRKLKVYAKGSDDFDVLRKLQKWVEEGDVYINMLIR